ncbi:MAG: DNA polymerase IV [Propionicimonas sp.]|uniref:DNA polymerase IV n=1 Tax=Propionicimonas sp. TaxID=1955623 RepID=UPI003D1448EE
MRPQASIMHLDLDAFFAAVEQRDKPSLRGKPVIVGGIGLRGVVSTASYEARTFGVGSAMAMSEARRRCPNAAFLGGRFDAYREASAIVMGLLRELSPLVEPLSLDEAFVDLAAGPERPLEDGALVALAQDLRARLAEATGGLTASVGLGSSKFIAKVASELAKPNGVRLVAPGTEVETIAVLPARAIPGVGPATMDRLSRLGVRTVADLQRLTLVEMVRELGKAGGEHLFALARADDDRAVEPERETKSISVEDTFEHDIADAGVLAGIADRQAQQVAERLGKAGLFARTVTVKVRWPDFSSVSRSRTLDGATDRAEVVSQIARNLLDGLETSQGVRLLGVGVSGLVEVAQEPLFDLEVAAVGRVVEEAQAPLTRRPSGWLPGSDVVHQAFGRGWVWGSGLGRVTVRFETAETGPGPVRTFAADDPALTPAPSLAAADPS